MIPLKLTVRNFLCYRDDVPPLDLRGVHVACLCGANGHGKSALLDAMTWCLWGQARTGGQSYNDLIAYGETECRVELDFLARSQTYRVIRRRRATGQGRTEVDLFILDDDAVARPVTGNSVRETNANIQRLVGMDYNTFVNTAFLLQGRSDEFTRKTPSDRKEVLASILGLGLYDLLQAEARGQRAQWEDTVTRTEGALERTKAALTAIPDPTEDLALIAQRLTTLDAKLATAAASAAQRRATVEELRRKQSELEVAVRRINALRNDIRQVEAAIGATRQRIADAHTLAEHSEAINAGVRQLASARAELNRLETARGEYDQLRNRRSELRTAIDRERAALDAEASQLERRIREEIEPQAGRAPEIAAQLATLAGAEQALTDDRNLIDAQATDAAELQGAITLRQSELERCISEGKELRAKQLEMKSVDALCPLCRTPLSEDACDNITTWYESEIEDKLRLHEEIKQTLTDLNHRYTGLTADAEQRRKSLDRRQRQTQRERGRLEQEQRQSEAAAEQLQSLWPRLAGLQETLAAGYFAVAQRDAADEIDRRIAALAYDDDTREEAYLVTVSLQHWEAELSDLQAALARLPDDETELQQSQTQAARWRDDLENAEATLTADQAAVADLPAMEQEAQAAEAALAELASERDDLLARQGRLQGDAERRRTYQEEVSSLEQRLSGAQTEQLIYADLFTAFGRSGVPAMLIDAAVPRIEAEANDLLGRMTDNRLALKLETQRDRRDGGVAETLDILISDELGARSYDLFSGGEAFRINLALRIALSKVLAQRMGLPLPTLFIDEGFGTQDAAGRERIVDAIASIQDDFEKIIVITHLEELKDLFPVRIEVMKTAAGSQFWLS